ncbi:MAG: hypothetical protein LKE85_02060 [Lachnospiraceae bacterium]|jgi:hypothetical protein|nr:hypothetical protein [Lachnospiraceae bacterium]
MAEDPRLVILNLRECFSIPDRLAPYVSDYKINLFEIAWLTDEQLKRFHSDFRIVADFFVQMRKSHEYEPSGETIQHVNEVLELMRVLTGDHRFLEFHNEKTKGGPTNMIDVFGKVLEQGREQGIEQGREQGREQGLAQGRAQGADENSQKIVRNLMKNHNMSFDEAVALIGLDESEIERLQKAMDKTA